MAHSPAGRPVPLIFSALLSAALALASGCDREPAGEPTGEPAAQQDVAALRAKARELQTALGQQLGGALKQAMADGGPAAAIEVCATRAQDISRSLGGDGWTVRRIGTRARNAANNTASSGEQAILEAFAAAAPADRQAMTHDELRADGSWAWYAPISISGPLCLTCHGDADKLPDAVRTRLNEAYPGDQAIGYAEGDLRGAFVVERSAE